MRKYIVAFWVLVLGGVLAVFMVFLLAANEFLGDMPSFQELENPNSNLASQVFSSDGEVLGSYFYQNRTNARYDQLSPYLVNALIATEDERYRTHPGIDIRGTLRAMVYLGSKGGASTITQQLAKMLFTEQRSTNIVRRILQKIKEWIISARLERYYTKEEIVAMYFNRFDFVNNAVGINTASRVYFNTTPDSLRLEQAAMLVGMAKNPSLFNPRSRPDTTLHRRNVVLGQMVRNKMITPEERDSIVELPLGIDFQSVSHHEGSATYFKETLRGKLKEILNEKIPGTDEYVISKKNGDPYNVYKDGLRIYTTIDSRMQKHAEDAVSEHLSGYLQDEFSKHLSKRSNFPFARLSDKEVESLMNTARKRTSRYRVLTGKECHNCHRRGSYVSEQNINGTDYWVCSAPECGEEEKLRVIPKDSIPVVFDTPVDMTVFSWKGEVDTNMSPNDSIRYYKSFLQAGLMSLDPHTGHIKAWVGGINHKYFEYDHVQLAKRQVGSTFKPFVYALALEAGYSACQQVVNKPYTFKKGEFGLLKDWTPKNDGDPYGYEVSLKYGLANSMNTITAYVMKQFTPQAAVQFARRCGIGSHIEPVPSLALGVADLSLYEMVSAYSTFPNKGIRMEPIYLLRIEDSHGTVIYESEQEIYQVMSEELAYRMIDIMKGVTEGVKGGPEGKKIGTGIRIRSNRPYGKVPWDVEIAGKTGTTQGNSDGWFMGSVPDLVTGVWVGADDRSVRFLYTQLGQGANTALPIWGYYMNEVWKDEELEIDQRPFDIPESLKNVNFDCDLVNPNSSSSGDDNLFD